MARAGDGRMGIMPYCLKPEELSQPAVFNDQRTVGRDQNRVGLSRALAKRPCIVRRRTGMRQRLILC
jgi:hypothetical protein